MYPASGDLVLDVVLDRVEKDYPSAAPAVFSRQERLARLCALLKQVFGPRAAGAAPDQPPRRKALADVSLTVGRGTVLGIYGEKGAGKTTLMRILAGLEQPTCGRVRLGGRVAGVFPLTEGPCHRQLSVRENVLLTATRLRLGRDWVRQNLPAITQYAQLTVAAKTPLGMVPKEAYWRFALALALRSDPQVLLLDELPLSSDPGLAEEVRREIDARRDAGRTTIITASHPAMLNPLCSHLAALEKGRLGECYVPCSEPANETSAAPPPLPPPPPPAGPLDWYWMSLIPLGWATYVRVDEPHVERKRAKGYRLIRATPPWVDEQGVCSLDPWQPRAMQSEEATAQGADEDPEMELT